jgi:hypothetical protein
MGLPGGGSGTHLPRCERLGHFARIAKDSAGILLPKVLELLGAAEVPVRRALCEQTEGIGAVTLDSPTLKDRLLIPVDAEPTEPIEDDLHHLLRGPILIGILDSEEEDSPLPAGHQPVEEGGPCTPHMEVSGG